MIEKEENKTARPLPDKMKPVEVYPKNIMMKKPRKCGNYGVLGHTKIQCTEPDINIKSNEVTAGNISKLFG